MQESDVGKVIFRCEEGGWRVIVARTIELFSPAAQRTSFVQKLCRHVPYLYVMEGLNGEALRNVPGGHFLSYYGCTPRRFYKIRTIEDLMWIHEVRHTHSWTVWGKQTSPTLLDQHTEETWDDWSHRMIASELDAAIMSEVMPHLVIPGVREASFKHPIWADRFLRRKKLMKRVKDGEISFKKLYKMVRKERLRVLRGKPEFDDYVERQIGGYYAINHDWTKLLGDEQVGYGPHADEFAFRCVEAHVPDREDPIKHGEWLKTVTPTRKDLKRLGIQSDEWNNYLVPFGRQAFSFGKIFAVYLEKFSNATFFH